MRDDKSFFFLQNLAYVYIASLQFYKQMYNKYIINKLLMWDSEEPAFVCSFFFFHLFLLWQYGGWWAVTCPPLRGVLVLLCAAAAEIHPAQVVPVCYPVVGAQSVASAVRRGVSAHRAFGGKVGRQWKEWKEENRARGKWIMSLTCLRQFILYYIFILKNIYIMFHFFNLRLQYQFAVFLNLTCIKSIVCNILMVLIWLINFVIFIILLYCIFIVVFFCFFFF